MLLMAMHACSQIEAWWQACLNYQGRQWMLSRASASSLLQAEDLPPILLFSSLPLPVKAWRRHKKCLFGECLLPREGERLYLIYLFENERQRQEHSFSGGFHVLPPNAFKFLLLAPRVGKAKGQRQGMPGGKGEAGKAHMQKTGRGWAVA